MASALEQFVNDVRTLSSQGNFRELCEMLGKSSDVLMKNGPHLDTVLETLDLQAHSLGVLAVLCAKFSLISSTTSSTQPSSASSSSPPPPQQQPPTAAVNAGGAIAQDNEVLFAQVQEFIIGCNGEQVRFAPDTYAELCHAFTQRLVELKLPLRGIGLLKRAIRKIQLFDSQLTSVHADLCQLCLLARCFKPALEFLDTDITSISQEGGHFDSRHFLLYHYYGGMIYAAVKDHARALYFFEVAVTTPAMAVSHIMLEAYKKYILISLILHGKVMTLPKYTSQVVGRFVKPLSQPYHDLANACSSNCASEVRAVLAKSHDIFARDGNIGLTKQVLSSLYKKNIQRLTKTFLTLSLSDVASRVHLSSPSEAEKYILNMIEDGEIFATINQKDGMVIFHDDPEKYNSPTMLRRLEEEMAICTELDRKMQAMEEEIIVNPQYVKKAFGGGQEEELPPSAGPVGTTGSSGSGLASGGSSGTSCPSGQVGSKLGTYSM
ncbi:COP9 signalosome complex subunit 3 [Ischnura elegans]|uniref:COP9 signalosome complex subunit 3 n=1 Tax=Ischnura elegans TaxID=197161 RepID=UPI001ED8669A|nr:COP9 signalosome complex subunit 3 [Ischnura elegans]XP_046404598.1 COP9 signalosome complex subunit 3 [Ischnura elegans]